MFSWENHGKIIQKWWIFQLAMFDDTGASSKQGRSADGQTASRITTIYTSVELKEIQH
jgi:hypothetical protein